MVRVYPSPVPSRPALTVIADLIRDPGQSRCDGSFRPQGRKAAPLAQVTGKGNPFPVTCAKGAAFRPWGRKLPSHRLWPGSRIKSAMTVRAGRDGTGEG